MTLMTARGRRGCFHGFSLVVLVSLSGCSLGPSAVGEQVNQTQAVVAVDELVAEVQASLLGSLQEFVAGRDQTWFNDPAIFYVVCGLVAFGMVVGCWRSWMFYRRPRR